MPTRYNRRLQGVCKCSGARISHFVHPEVQFGESGVRLVSATHPCSRCHTPLHQYCQSFVCKEKRVKMRAISVRLRVLLAMSRF